MPDPIPKQHGLLDPTDGKNGQPAIHVIQGQFLDTDHEGTRKAIVIATANVGGVVHQTAGAVPGWYLAIDTGTGLDKWAPIHGDVTTQPATILVRTADGDDSNDGIINPLKTETEAVLRTPYRIEHQWIVDLGNGTYPAFVWGPRVLGDQLAVIGGGGGIGDGLNELQASQTADAGTGAGVVNKIGGGLTPNDPLLRSRTIDLLTGPGSPQRKLIKSNTTVGYIPARDFSPAPDNTTTYRIVEAAVKLQYTGFLTSHFEIEGAAPPSPSLFFGSGNAPCYSLNQIKLTTDDAGPIATFSNVGLALYGVETGGAGNLELALNQCAGFFGTDANGVFAAIPRVLGFAAGDGEWLGYGLGEVDASSLFITGFNSVMHMYLGAVKGLLAKNYVFTLYGGRLSGPVSSDVLELTENAIGIVTGTFGSNSVVDIDALGGNDAVEVHDLANLLLLDSILSAVSGDLVHAREGGQVTIFSSATGASASGKAVLSDSGRVFLHGAPALTGSPTVSEYDVGGGSFGQAAFFATVGDYLANADGGVIKRSS